MVIAGPYGIPHKRTTTLKIDLGWERSISKFNRYDDKESDSYDNGKDGIDVTFCDLAATVAKATKIYHFHNEGMLLHKYLDCTKKYSL